MAGSLNRNWLTGLFRRDDSPALAENLVREADAFYVQSDYAAAEAGYRKAIMAAAGFALAHQGLGATLLALGRLDEAAAALTQALQINGKLVGSNEMLATCCLFLEDNEQAERHFRIALASGDADRSSYLSLGSILVNQRRYAEALQTVEAGVSAFPDFVELQTFLGNLCFEAGRFAQARDAFRAALQANPDQALAINNLGLTLIKTNELDAAAEAFRRATELNPDWADAYNNLGYVLRLLNKQDEARTCFERALLLDSSLVNTHFNLGEIALAQADAHFAEQCYRNAIALNPDMAEAHLRLAAVLAAHGRSTEAQEHLSHALEIVPGNVDALALSASLHSAHGNFAQALSAYREITAAVDDNVDALIGIVMNALKLAEISAPALRPALLDEAIAICRGLLARFPNHFQACYFLGVALGARGKFDEADDQFRAVLVIDPRCANAHHNLGVSMESRGRKGSIVEKEACFARALEHYSATIAIEPDHIDALMGMGSVYGEQLRIDEARAAYEKIVQIDPEYAPGRMSLGMLKLLIGEFATGWQDMEYRWQLGAEWVRIKSDRPHWRNDASLEGKTIILYHEQGLGDSLQFVRYAKLVAEAGATVVAMVPPSLRLLFESCPGVNRVISIHDDLPAHDYVCSFMGLAEAFGTRLDTIPSGIPYLCAKPERLVHWREKFGTEKGLRVGLVWAGDPRKHAPNSSLIDGMRSMHFDQLRPLLNLPGVIFYSVQVGADAAAQLTDAPQVIDFTGELSDFQETAALAANLDLAICVDTSSAHLIGAIGKPVWLLNRFNTCWRWMLERNDSPWYPSMRIFRQPRLGDWESVVAEVKLALEIEAARAAQA